MKASRGTGRDCGEVVFTLIGGVMDTDKTQMNHHGVLHHEKNGEDATLTHVSSLSERGATDQEAEMDALEARLFAMAKSRS